MFRPGYMHSTPDMKNTNKYYKYISWLYPALKVLLPNSVSTLRALGLAMINVTLHGYEKHIIEVKDIKKLAGVE